MFGSHETSLTHVSSPCYPQKLYRDLVTFIAESSDLGPVYAYLFLESTAQMKSANFQNK